MGDVDQVELTYLEDEALIVLRYLAPFRMESEGDVAATLSKVVRFWRDRCGGERVYLVVDYANFSLDLAINETFGREIKLRLLDKFVIAILRFGGTTEARAAARTRAIRAQVPSFIYPSLEEAKRVVREMRAASAEGRGPLSTK